ncbi:AsmA family protein [Rhodoligotrophos ferricapiens]|uniref:AsmA family protein n=1 Tax=Rhodoligotrophos ferricapiens TaxID=3069264 RepID=UPI00315D9CC5
MKRLVIGLTAVVLVAILALAALPFVISADFVARQITEAVREQTGREITLGEPPSLSFYPDFGIELNDVALSNPPGMPSGNVMLTDSLRVKVALLPLLSGKLDIKAFVVDMPRLNLLIDGEGHSNWVFDSRGQPATNDQQSEAAAADEEPADALDAPTDPTDYPDTAAQAVTFAPIEIRNGTVRYLDERNGVNFMAEQVNVTLTLANLDAPFQAKGSLIWNGQQVSFDGTLRQPTQLAAGSASAADLTLTSPLMNVGYDGQISLKDGLSLAGVIGFTTPSLRELMQWAGKPLPDGRGLGSFRAESAIGLQHDVLTLKEAEITLDGMQGRGNVRVELEGPRPKVIATLGVDTIDVNVYRASTGPQTEPQGEREPSALVDGWSSEPIDLSGLKALDADLTLNTGRVIFGDLKTEAGGLRLLIDDGLLEAQLNDLSLYGGTAAGNIQIDGSKEVPVLRMVLSANNFDSYGLLRDFSGLDRIEGRGATSISLTAQGSSQAALMSTMRGQVTFRLTDGAVRGVNLPGMVRNVAAHVVDGWQGTGQDLTDFSIFEGTFDIENGLAANSDLTLMGPLVRVTGEGSIDLPSQTIDYRIDPKLVAMLQPKEGEQAFEGFNVPIVVKGPWARPKIYPDLEGILKDPQAAYRQFKGLVKAAGAINPAAGQKLLEDAMGGAGVLLGDRIRTGLGGQTESLTGDGASRFIEGLTSGGFGKPAEVKPEEKAASPDAPQEPGSKGDPIGQVPLAAQPPGTAPGETGTITPDAGTPSERSGNAARQDTPDQATPLSGTAQGAPLQAPPPAATAPAPAPSGVTAAKGDPLQQPPLGGAAAKGDLPPNVDPQPLAPQQQAPQSPVPQADGKGDAQH